MNFTSEVKKEILSKRREKLKGKAAKAALSAFVRTSGSVGFVHGQSTFFLVSETEFVAEYFTSLFFETFNAELSLTTARMDRMSGRDKLVFECPAGQAEEVLKELGLLSADGKTLLDEIPEELVETDEEKLAYVKGSFLGGGSCIVPTESGKAGYHLEFVFSERKIAEQFCELLEVTEVLAKVVERKETFVAYVKSKEMISDFLAALQAPNALKKFISLVEKRDEANQKNRAANCISGNADKSALAAVKQVVAIRKLAEAKAFEGLSEELKDLAILRLKEPSKSLQELADIIKVSKSCLNHRMRRLMELSEKISDKE
ncbi:MAG: DNA-binding protein WhiA [Clostridia bacterium]|nr:DNA-binding protein WhiA [Clostridia bacterium]